MTRRLNSFNVRVICNNIKAQIKARFCPYKNLNIEVSATDNRSIQITRSVCHNREIGHGSYYEDEALNIDTSRLPIYTHNHTLMALAEAAMPTLDGKHCIAPDDKVPHASWVFPCSVYRLRYSHIHLQTHWAQSGVQYLTQGHFDVHTDAAIVVQNTYNTCQLYLLSVENISCFTATGKRALTVVILDEETASSSTQLCCFEFTGLCYH